MTVTLRIAGVPFEDFEIPDSINFGGDQFLVVHKYPGGGRIIDAMGRDDKDITWSGRFRGSNAELRARALDLLRIQGIAVPLSWSTFLYQVVIRSFEAHFQQPFEIPYTITCTVLNDEFNVLSGLLGGVDAAISTDLNNIVTLGGALSATSVTTAISGVQAAIAAVPTLSNASAGDVSTINTSIASAQAATQSATTTVNASLNTTGSVAGVVPGGAPATMASSLSSQTAAFAQLSQLQQVSSSLARMSTNLANARN